MTAVKSARVGEKERVMGSECDKDALYANMELQEENKMGNSWNLWPMINMKSGRFPPPSFLPSLPSSHSTWDKTQGLASVRPR